MCDVRRMAMTFPTGWTSGYLLKFFVSFPVIGSSQILPCSVPCYAVPNSHSPPFMTGDLFLSLVTDNKQLVFLLVAANEVHSERIGELMHHKSDS